MYRLGRESPEEEAAKPSSGASGRKGSKKVRSGCITCKIRKVKCDEAKPYCVRCTKTGRKCDGYLDDAALAIRRRRRRRTITDSLGDHRAGDSEGLTAAASELITSASGSALSSLTPPLSVSTVPRSPGMVLWESAQEKQSFEFFQHITAPVLAGDLDAVFWRVLVLQICHTEPAVRHAVMAISSLHEALLSVSSEPATKTHNEGLAPVSPPSCRISTSQQQDFALQQYNKAISYLLEDIKASNEPDIKGTESTASLRRPVAPLMTCLLFVCIEVMQGKDRDALVHLEQGRRLLSQLPGGNIPSTFMPEPGTPTKGNDDPELAVIHKHLVPLYSRLSMTSFLFGGNPEPIPPALKTARTGRTDSFDSIHSLRTAVHDFVDDVLRFVQRARPIKYPTPSPQRHSSPSSYASSRPPTSPSSSPPASPLSPSSLVFQSPPPSPSVDEGDIRQPSQIPQTSIAQYELETCRHALSAELGRLRVALSLFRVNQSAVVAASASPNSAALSLLQMHLCIAEVWLATATTRFETAYDAHVETFSTIVSLAVSALEAEQQQCQKRQQQQQQHAKYHRPCDPAAAASASVFTLETYVIPALYYVATKCRHGLVRHAALSLLLRNGGRRENLWRAGVLGAITRRIIEVEEGYVDVKAEDVEMEADGNHENTVKEEDSNRATFANTGWTEWHGHEAYPHPDLRLNSKPIFAADHDTPMQSAFDNWGAENTFGFDDTEPETRGSWQESVTDIDERTEEHRQMPVKISASSLSSTPCVSSSAANAVPNSSKQRSMEPPFDIPEGARVHTAVIGPDEDKGRWVTLFRKLKGLEGAWDVRAEFVAS